MHYATRIQQPLPRKCVSLSILSSGSQLVVTITKARQMHAHPIHQHRHKYTEHKYVYHCKRCDDNSTRSYIE